MLARSVMIVVFVLDELISLGRSQPDGRRFSLGKLWKKTIKVPQRRVNMETY